MHIQYLTIGGMCLELRSSIPTAELGIEPTLGPFFSGSPIVAADSVVSWADGDTDYLGGDLIYDPGSIWRMYKNSSRQCFQARIAYGGNSDLSGRALLTTNPAWSDITLIERRLGIGWRSLLALGAGELILRTRILFHGGIVFHAFGVDDNGRGLLFAGPSGVGKSTQAAIWAQVPGTIALNDDRVGVGIDVSGARIFGTPWGGTADIARNVRAPLRAILLLEQGPENSIHALTRESSVPRLLTLAFLPYWDVKLMELAFETVAELVRMVPVYLLRCRPESGVIPLVRSVL